MLLLFAALPSRADYSPTVCGGSVGYWRLNETVTKTSFRLSGGSGRSCPAGDGARKGEVRKRGVLMFRFTRSRRDQGGTKKVCPGDFKPPGQLQRGNFSDLSDWVGPGAEDGVFLDLGISSLQLDLAVRGSSFVPGGPLDMRMDQRQSLADAAVDNTSSAAQEFKRVEHFRHYTEALWSRCRMQSFRGNRISQHHGLTV